MTATDAGPTSGTPRPTCPWCGAPGGVLHANLRDRLYETPGIWTLRRCPTPACGLVWLDPLPHDVASLYARYFTHGADQGSPRRRAFWQTREPLLRMATRAIGGRSALERDRRALALLVPRPDLPQRVLDVGCGSGDRLLLLRRLGWEVMGQEVDPQAVAAAQRAGVADVRLGDLCALGLPEGCVDAVVSSHVIEHVADPVALLRECLRLVAPPGSVTIVTPNIDSWGHGRFGANWLGLDPPRHLHLFSPTTLEALARHSGARDVCVWTSAAQAEFIAGGSIDLRARGVHHIGEGGRPWRDAMALVAQRSASRAHRRSPLTGDECVLQIDVR